MLTSRCAALVVVMPQMTHSCLSRGAESDPASEAEYSGVAVPDAESSWGPSSPPFFLFSKSAEGLNIRTCQASRTGTHSRSTDCCRQSALSQSALTWLSGVMSTQHTAKEHNILCTDLFP